MGKQSYFLRYTSILTCLERKKCKFEDINKYIRQSLSLHGFSPELSYTLRTFQRDIQDIKSNFAITIKCNTFGEYFLDADAEQYIYARYLLESFHISRLLHIHNGFENYISFEPVCKTGLHYIEEILLAIRERLCICIVYQPYEKNRMHRTVEPYGLKEFHKRWYLVAKEPDNKSIKTYGLDRIREIYIISEKFIYPTGFIVNNYFKDYFGIVRGEDQPPEKIILSFDPLQGNYVKAHPLHSSQKEILVTGEEYRVELNLVITYEFIQELLYLHNRVKVISPVHLIEKLKQEAHRILSAYKE